MTMGLFGKKSEPQPQPQEPAKNEPTFVREVETITLNIPEKGVRVELVEDNACVRYAQIRQVDDKIQIVSQGRILIAEISKKTKAYSEIEPKIGQSCDEVIIDAKNGDYGPYYRVKIKFSTSVAYI